MAADKFYSLEDVDTLQSQLKDFSYTPRTQFSKKQVVETLIEDIEEALEDHPYEQVAEKLKEWNFDISASSLRQYVSAYRRKHKDKTEEQHPTTEKKASRKSKQSTQRESQSTKRKPAHAESALSGQHSLHLATQAAKNSRSEQTSEENEQSLFDKAAPGTKKLGKGRLQSEDNSARYSDEHGNPLEVKTDR